MKRQSGWTVWEALIAVIILAGGWGWIWNIIKLAGMGLDPLTGLLILRAVGIFVFPVGMIVGYF